MAADVAALGPSRRVVFVARPSLRATSAPILSHAARKNRRSRLRRKKPRRAVIVAGQSAARRASLIVAELPRTDNRTLRVTGTDPAPLA